MLLTIILALALILYSNLIVYKTLKITKTITNIKEYFEYDERALVFINLVMLLISAFIIVCREVIYK